MKPLVNIGWTGMPQGALLDYAKAAIPGAQGPGISQ